MALNNVPLTGQSLGITKTPINQNFATINAAFAIDHVEMTPPGTAQPQGYHNQVSLVEQVASPAPSWGTTYNGIYCLQSAYTGIQETFFHNQQDGGAADIPITASILSTTTPAALSAGWAYLPSGILIKWGSSSATGQTTITFPTGASIPPYTTCFQVFLTVQAGSAGDSNSFVRLTAVNPTTFAVYASPRVTTGSGICAFGYLAIGY